MDDLIQAIKSNDLVAVRKVFEAHMAPVVSSLIEAEKIKIARSIMIEGEEPNEDEDDGDDKDEKKKKNKEESDGKGADSGGDADEGDDDEDEDD
ncbi:MAG: prohead core protein [Enterobacter phage ENC9]|nr:MAG: prohead core protein [Enterobacter phage ENC9]